jgi:soluble lytic murein transglycosylase-like protein
MTRWLGILALFLVVLAWVYPAAAAIERFTDSAGVIHIRNGAAKAGQPRIDPLSEERGVAPATGILPDAAGAQGEQRRVAAAEQSIATEPAAGSKVTAPSEAAPDDGNPAAAAATPRTPEVVAPATGTGGPILQKVSWTPQAEHVSLRPRYTATARQFEGADGSIKQVRDRQGVLHITNEPPAGPAAPARLQAANPGSPASPTEAPPVAAMADNATAVQRVSCPEAELGLMALNGAGRGGKAKPALTMPGTITRFRDKKGVVHIDNVSPQQQEDGFEQLLLARGSQNIAARRAKRYESYLSPTDGGLPAGLIVRKADWTAGAAGLLRAKSAKARKPKNPGAWSGETVKRFRDAKGVVHITSINPEAAWIAPSPPQLAARAAPAAPGLIGSPGAPPTGPQVAPGTGLPPNHAPGVAGVMAYRDRKGKTVISNSAPPSRITRPPSVDAGATAYEAVIAEASQAHGLPAALVKAVIKVESNFVPGAVSPKGAMGMMQLMPGTADFLGVREPFNARENIHGGCKYLRMLLNFFGGNLALALAGYNAGYQRVVSCGFKVPPIKETQEFVTNVLGRYYAAENQALWPWT